MSIGMLLLSLALVQAVSAAPTAPIDILVPQPCRPEQAEKGEVVVCANRNGESPYRLKQPPAKAREGLPKAEARIAEGVAIGAETEAADVGGVPSDRGMIRLKVKF